MTTINFLLNQIIIKVIQNDNKVKCGITSSPPPPPKKNEILSSACYGKKLEKITLCSIYACQHEMTLNSV